MTVKNPEMHTWSIFLITSNLTWCVISKWKSFLNSNECVWSCDGNIDFVFTFKGLFVALAYI